MEVFAILAFQPHTELQRALWEFPLYHIACVLMKIISKLSDDLVRAHSCRYSVMVDLSRKDARHRPAGCCGERYSIGRAIVPNKSIRFLPLLICIGLAGCSGQAEPTQSQLPSPTAEMASPTAVEASRVILDVFGDEVTSVDFSPDGSLIATGSWDPDIGSDNSDEIRIWDVSSGELLQSLSGHEKRVLSVAFSPDGRWLAAGLVDNYDNVLIWDINSGKIAATLEGHESWVRSVAFSPDGRLLASASGEMGRKPGLKIWNVATSELVATLEGHTDYVNSVAFSPDGDYLASGSSDGSVKIWDVTTHELVRTLGGDSGEVLSVAFSPDGRLLATGPIFDTVNLWEVNSGELVETQDRGTYATSMDFSPDSRLMATGLVDGSVLVWDLHGIKPPLSLQGHSERVTSVAFSPDGDLLASGSMDGTVVLWPSPDLYADLALLPDLPDSGVATDVPSATPTPEEVSIVQLDAFGVSMIRIPGGKYEVGGKPEQSLEICLKYRDDCLLEWFVDETPVHQVTLDEFMIDQFEVTNAHYAECVDAGVCSPPDLASSATRSSYYGDPVYDDYPVIYASWEDANSYCNWRGARLPTEAEWETAARGDRDPFPWGSSDPVCNPGSFNGAKFDDEDVCNDTDTEAVGSYLPNDYKLYDMAGNVIEWTADWYDAYPGGDSSSSSEYGETYRVARGGSWYTYGYFLRANIRLPVVPHLSLDHYGIRCAKTPADESTAEQGQPPVNVQEELKNEWRPAISNAMLLFTSCQLMFETHFKYGEGQIDLDRALFELDAESDFIGFAVRGFASGPVPSEAVAPFMLQLETQTGTLIELLDPIDDGKIGSAEVLDTLLGACGTFNNLLSNIVNASMDSGLSEASVDEIDQEMTPMINDLYNTVQG